MTQPPSEQPTDMPYRDMEAQLPWYVNRTLPEPERADVERQVAMTPELQSHLAAWQHLAEAVQAVEVVAPEPSAEGFAALMSQIDAAAAPPLPVPTPTRWARLAARLRMLRQSWSAAPGATQFALGLQCALIVLCIAGITLPWPWFSPASYQTLSNGNAASPASRGQIRLVVADEMTIGELRMLLGRVRATIVDGPSAMGVYTLAVSRDAHTALSTVLQTLRTHEHVTLAEPML